MIDTQVSAESLAAALERLDRFEDADALADHLRSQGIRGVRRGCSECPIAVALTREVIPDQDDAVVMTGLINAWIREGVETDDPSDGRPVPLPPTVRRFVHLFDTFKYPDLIGGAT